MNVTTVSRQAASAPAPAAPPPPTPETPAAAPHDGFAKSAGHEAARNAVAWGNAMGTVTGGAGAITLTGAALYAGVLGGAIAGSTIGLGLGPVVGSLGSSGALNFLSTTFSTAGVAAKAGIILGGAAMGAGAWDVGAAVGNAIGKPTGALLGLPVGFARGAWNAVEGAASGEAPASTPSRPATHKQTSALDLNEMHGVTKLYATALGGAGLVTGGIGGAVLGGSLASAGNLVSGLLARNVSMAALSGAAGVGAAVGGALGAVLGGRGGFKLAKGVQAASEWVGNTLIKKKDEGAAPQPSSSGSTPVAEKSKVVGATIAGFSQDLSPARIGFDVADTGLGLAQAFGKSAGPSALDGASKADIIAGMGYAIGAAHVALAVGNAIGAACVSESYQYTEAQKPEVIHHRLYVAAGEAITAAGHFAGAAGAGGWALPILGAGMLLTTVADHRHNNV